jgi:hypothetical protein
MQEGAEAEVVVELRCFASYTSDASSSLVDQLNHALLRLGVDPISHGSFLFGPGADLIRRIDSSDFLVAIVGNISREQIMLETGITLGLSRPVLLIREPDATIPGCRDTAWAWSADAPVER